MQCIPLYTAGKVFCLLSKVTGVRPQGPIQAGDFESVAKVVAPYIQRNGQLRCHGRSAVVPRLGHLHRTPVAPALRSRSSPVHRQGGGSIRQRDSLDRAADRQTFRQGQVSRWPNSWGQVSLDFRIIRRAMKRPMIGTPGKLFEISECAARKCVPVVRTASTLLITLGRGWTTASLRVLMMEMAGIRT